MLLKISPTATNAAVNGHERSGRTVERSPVQNSDGRTQIFNNNNMPSKKSNKRPPPSQAPEWVLGGTHDVERGHHQLDPGHVVARAGQDSQNSQPVASLERVKRRALHWAHAAALGVQESA